VKEVKNKIKIGRIIREIREDCEKELTMFYQRPVKVNIFVTQRNNKSVEEMNEREE